MVFFCKYWLVPCYDKQQNPCLNPDMTQHNWVVVKKELKTPDFHSWTTAYYNQKWHRSDFLYYDFPLCKFCCSVLHACLKFCKQVK